MRSLNRFAYIAVLTSIHVACASDEPATLDAAPSATPTIAVQPQKIEPKVAEALGPTRYPASSVLSPVTPPVAERLRWIANRNATRKNDVFIKVGDSHVVSGNFLHCFAKAEPPVELAKSVEFFRGSFARESLATLSGKTAGWAFAGNPSPLNQELSAMNPRFAFVSFGSNDMEAGRNYATALRTFHDALSGLLERLEQAGVVPILSGLPPRGGRRAKPWTGIYDALTRGIAEAHQIPYFSVYVANQQLPAQGLVSDRLHENVFVRGIREPCNFSPQALAHGYNLRNLRSMQQLDLVKRIVVDGVSAPDSPPAAIAGLGSAARPFEIDSLPFTHSFDVSRGERAVEQHRDCKHTGDAFGPAVSYRFTLEHLSAVRFVVFGSSSVSLRMLGVKNACGERSVQRRLPAGTHTVEVGSSAGSGPYLFVAVRCEAGDVDCQ